MSGNFGNYSLSIGDGSAPSTPSGGVVLYSSSGELNVITPTTTVPLNSSCRVFTATNIGGGVSYTPDANLLALIRTPGAPGVLKFMFSAFLDFEPSSSGTLGVGLTTDQVTSPITSYAMNIASSGIYNYLNFPIYTTVSDIADASNNTFSIYMGYSTSGTLSVYGPATTLYVEYFIS